MTTYKQDLQKHSKPAKAATPPVSTPKPQDDPERVAWRREMGRKMMEASEKMTNDPEYRKLIQSMVR